MDRAFNIWVDRIIILGEKECLYRLMYRWTGGWIDRWTKIWTYRQTDKRRDRWTDKRTDRWTDRWMDRWTYKWIHRQIDVCFRWTDRCNGQINTHIHRWTDKQKLYNIHRWTDKCIIDKLKDEQLN